MAAGAPDLIALEQRLPARGRGGVVGDGGGDPGDSIDPVAHRVGLLLRRYPEPIRATMLAWSRSDDLWKRRASIICQNRFKANTDLGLLYACIEPSLASREFFLRKAIGWALRQYAGTDPAEVVRYVAAHQDRLSGLSQREALKNVPAELRLAEGAAS